MNLTPNAVLNSFLAQAKELKMAVVVFAGFVDGGSARFVSKHTLKEGTEKAFLGKFLATDDAAVEAAAKAISEKIGHATTWSELEEGAKNMMREAARAGIEAARDPERPKILASPS